MRTLRLARIAAEAEGIRLRRRVQRNVVRAVMTLIALWFLLAAVVFFHVAGWFWLRERWEAPASAMIVAGVDIVLAGLLGLLAARSSASRTEIEALAVRQRAMESITSTLAVSTLATQLLRLAANYFRRSRS
jgi:hypothetical protein